MINFAIISRTLPFERDSILTSELHKTRIISEFLTHVDSIFNELSTDIYIFFFVTIHPLPVKLSVRNVVRISSTHPLICTYMYTFASQCPCKSFHLEAVMGVWKRDFFQI